jgi:hypothetical protein
MKCTQEKSRWLSHCGGIRCCSKGLLKSSTKYYHSDHMVCSDVLNAKSKTSVGWGLPCTYLLLYASSADLRLRLSFIEEAKITCRATQSHSQSLEMGPTRLQDVLQYMRGILVDIMRQTFHVRPMQEVGLCHLHRGQEQGVIGGLRVAQGGNMIPGGVIC